MDIFFGVITKLDYILGSILCNLVFFSLGHGTEWVFLWVAEISNIFLGCLEFLIFFRGEG